MTDQEKEAADQSAKEFARAAKGDQTGLVRELTDSLRHNNKWWLTPIILMLVIVSVLVILGSSAAAPFIYTLF